MYLGFSLRAIGQEEEDLYHTLKAIKIAQEQENWFLLGRSKTCFGYLYNDLGRYQDAEKVLLEARKL